MRRIQARWRNVVRDIIKFIEGEGKTPQIALVGTSQVG
jgi:hypothetical protein